MQKHSTSEWHAQSHASLNMHGHVSLTLAKYFSQRSVDTYFPIFLSSLTWSSIRGLGTEKSILMQKIKHPDFSFPFFFFSREINNFSLLDSTAERVHQTKEALETHLLATPPMWCKTDTLSVQGQCRVTSASCCKRVNVELTSWKC